MIPCSMPSPLEQTLEMGSHAIVRFASRFRNENTLHASLSSGAGFSTIDLHRMFVLQQCSNESAS